MVDQYADVFEVRQLVQYTRHFAVMEENIISGDEKFWGEKYDVATIFSFAAEDKREKSFAILAWAVDFFEDWHQSLFIDLAVDDRQVLETVMVIIFGISRSLQVSSEPI